MKNSQERREFVDNPENWHVIEMTKHARISAIRYKGEERYELETFEVMSRFDYAKGEPYDVPEWFTRNYFKESDDFPGTYEAQSLTQIRDWVADQDRKGGAE